MKQRRLPEALHFVPAEAHADALIWGGDTEVAEGFLAQNIQHVVDKRTERDRKMFHHLSIKQATLPLYELKIHGATKERIDQSQDAYGELAELLAAELTYLAQTTTHGEFARSKGRASELAVLCLMARDIQFDNPTLILLPATRNDDMSGTDYYLSTVKDKGDAFYPIQLKTQLSDETRQQYSESTIMIGLNEVDPVLYYHQNHDNSLSMAMLRELDGRATEADDQLLYTATVTFYDRISEQVSGFESTNYPTEPGFRQLAAA